MLNAAGTPVVEARDVTVAIGGRPVLRGNDLVVREGEFVALMGANGSGKSTLVRALTGLRPLTHGSVLLFGTPLHDFKARHRIGYVPQRGTATGGVPASVREVVASGRLTRRGLLRPAGRADRAAIADALEVVGLTDQAGDGVSTLSGGQQQRVLIARALAGEPDLFFLDEPTAGRRPAQPAGPRRRPAHAVGPRRDRRPRRPRARPARAAGRPRGRDARRPDRLRRPAALAPRTCTATTTRSTPATTTCRTSARPSTRLSDPREGGR